MSSSRCRPRRQRRHSNSPKASRVDAVKVAVLFVDAWILERLHGMIYKQPSSRRW